MLTGGDVPGRRGRRPSGTGWPTGSRSPRRQPAHLARVALLKRVYGTHPYAVQTPDRSTQVQAVKPAALRTLHAERLHPTGAILVLVGDISAGEGDRRGRDGARPAGPATASDARLPPIPAAGRRPDRAGRPARLGAVVDPARAAGGRPDPPGLRRAAAGQPGLRRLLLVPLGGEHPRGQGLHVQPALRASSTRSPARC